MPSWCIGNEAYPRGAKHAYARARRRSIEERDDCHSVMHDAVVDERKTETELDRECVREREGGEKQAALRMDAYVGGIMPLVVVVVVVAADNPTSKQVTNQPTKRTVATDGCIVRSKPQHVAKVRRGPKSRGNESQKTKCRCELQVLGREGSAVSVADWTRCRILSLLFGESVWPSSRSVFAF